MNDINRKNKSPFLGVDFTTRFVVLGFQQLTSASCHAFQC